MAVFYSPAKNALKDPGIHFLPYIIPETARQHLKLTGLCNSYKSSVQHCVPVLSPLTFPLFILKNYP